MLGQSGDMLVWRGPGVNVLIMGTLCGKGLIKEKINRGLSWKAAKSQFSSITGDNLPIYVEILTEESNFINFGR